MKTIHLNLIDDVEEICNADDPSERRILFTQYLIKHQRNRKLRGLIYLVIISISIGIGTLI